MELMPEFRPDGLHVANVLKVRPQTHPTYGMVWHGQFLPGNDMTPGNKQKEIKVRVAYSLYTNITSFYGSSYANNGKGALNTPDLGE
eukprot:1058270-Prorocentrum_minimum.AAC.1